MAMCLYSGLGLAGDAKDDHLQAQNHHDCTRVARDDRDCFGIW